MSLHTIAGLSIADLATIRGLARVALGSIDGLSPMPVSGLPPTPAGSDPYGGADSYSIAGAGATMANKTVTYAGYLDIGTRWSLWVSADLTVLMVRHSAILPPEPQHWTMWLDVDADETYECKVYASGDAQWTAPTNTWVPILGAAPAPTVTAVP